MNKNLTFNVLLFFITVMGSCWSYAREFKSDKTYSPKIDHDDGIYFDSFVQKMKDHDVTTLEGALGLVPEEFYNNYVLMYRSRSLQDASPLYPRVILFGRSAKFIMAFNGHEQQKGFNNLEIIQFRESEHKWEFREVTFFADKAPQVSQANPQKCLECHQSPKRTNVDPRPNWEPYNFWPGSYASVDSTLVPSLKKPYEEFLSGERNYVTGTLARFLPQDFILAEEQSHELENLNMFFDTNQQQHPRYRHLKNFNMRDPLHLTKAVVALNMRRVARLIKEELGDVLFPLYKYAVLGIAHVKTYQSSTQLRFACNELYLPLELLEKHVSMVEKVKTIEKRLYVKEAAPHWDLSFEAATDILMKPFGIMTDDWSMDFRTDGRFSVLDRFSSPHHSATQFRDAIEYVYAGDSMLQKPCTELKELSMNQLSDVAHLNQIDKAMQKAQEPEVITSTARPLIQRCIACHVNETYSEQAPYIPFDDFSRLKPLLQEGKYPRGTLYQEILYRIGDHAPLRDQMPPSGGVSRVQRDQLIDSLTTLLGH